MSVDFELLETLYGHSDFPMTGYHQLLGVPLMRCDTDDGVYPFDYREQPWLDQWSKQL